VTNPHDALFRFTFGQVEHALGLLRQLVPHRLAEAIDWSALHTHPTTTADQGLRLHHADLLFQAELIGALPVTDSSAWPRYLPIFST
jgi:predicted transposase YdaD